MGGVGSDGLRGLWAPDGNGCLAKAKVRADPFVIEAYLGEPADDATLI